MTTIYQLNILEELKWDKNLKIPLSDKPNSEIEDEMHKTAEVLETEKVELHTAEVSVANLNRLLLDCGRQLKETQNLLAARKNEFESANRMYKLAVQDKQRFCRDVQRTEKELDDLNKLDDKLQKSKEDKMELIERIKKELDWDEQVMEAWVNDCKRLEDDSNILQKYTRHDDEKLKTLDILMANRFQDLNKIRKQSEMQRDEILSTQYMLDHMAGVFRTAHESRNQLITNWEKTLEQMFTRDRQIQDLANRLFEAKRELKEKELESKEKDNFLHAQQENNKMTRLKTSRLLEKRSNLSEELQELEKICHHLQSDYNICRTTVRSTSNELDQTRAEISLHKKTIDEKAAQLTNLNIDCEMLRDRLEMCNSKTKTVEERLHIFDKMLKEDSLCQDLILLRLHKLYTAVENAKVELIAKRDVEKGLILEQENLQGLLKTLQKKINTADELSLRQFDKMFDQGYKLLHLERKYQAMTGDNLSLMEKRKLDDKISAALKELNEKQKNHHLIDMQLNELKKERKLAYEEKNRVDAIERTQRDEIHSAKCALEITRAIKRKRRAEKNNLLTDANILQLRLDQLAIQFQQKSMDVVHLESERLQLDTAMKERFILVKSQQEQLALVLKDLEMERHKLVCELSERMLQINNHKLKYETALLPMQTDSNMDESAPLKYIMKFVAERQELVQQGDRLNAELTKTEKETAALANTLHLLQMHNSIQFENTATVSPHDQDLNKIQELKEELTEKSIYRRGKQRTVKSLKEENQKLESTLNKLKKDENVMQKFVQTKERDARGLEKDVKHNAAMLQRSIEMCSRIFRRMRSAAKTIDCLPEEFDMDVRQLVDMNREASCKLIEANKEFPEMVDRLNQFLDQCDVDFCVAKFPSRTDSYSTVKTLSKSMVSGKGTPRVASEFLFGTVDQGKSEQDITLRFSTSRSSTYVCSSTSSPTSSTSSRNK